MAPIRNVYFFASWVSCIDTLRETYSETRKTTKMTEVATEYNVDRERQIWTARSNRQHRDCIAQDSNLDGIRMLYNTDDDDDLVQISQNDFESWQAVEFFYRDCMSEVTHYGDLCEVVLARSGNKKDGTLQISTETPPHAATWYMYQWGRTGTAYTLALDVQRKMIFLPSHCTPSMVVVALFFVAHVTRIYDVYTTVYVRVHKNTLSVPIVSHIFLAMYCLWLKRHLHVCSVLQYSPMVPHGTSLRQQLRLTLRSAQRSDGSICGNELQLKLAEMAFD